MFADSAFGRGYRRTDDFQIFVIYVFSSAAEKAYIISYDIFMDAYTVFLNFNSCFLAMAVFMFEK